MTTAFSSILISISLTGSLIQIFMVKEMICHFLSLIIHFFPLSPSYCVYISQLVWFARVCNNVSDFNERNLCITEKLLHQGFRYQKLVKTFTKFYHRYKEIIRKYHSTCRHFICSGISHPIFYGNNLYKAQKYQYSSQKLTKPLNRLIKKGYSYDTVVRSLKIAYFGFNIDSLIGSLNRN